MNKTILTGTIFKDMKYTPSQGNVPSVVRFTLSVRNNYKTKKSDKYEYTYIPCTAWRHTADFINKHFKDGDAIEITDASIQNNNWEKDGIKHYDLVVNVEQVEFPVNAYVQPSVPSEGVKKIDDDLDDNEKAHEEFLKLINSQAQIPSFAKNE